MRYRFHDDARSVSQGYPDPVRICSAVFLNRFILLRRGCRRIGVFHFLQRRFPFQWIVGQFDEFLQI
jgi:hypothetical protein